MGCSPWGHKELYTTKQLHFTHFILYHWRRKWQPTPVFLPGEPHGQRSLAGHGPWGCRELDTTEVTEHEQTHTHTHTHTPGLPSWLRKQTLCLQCKKPSFDPWIRKIPWRRAWLPTPVLLPGESHGQKSLAGYSPRNHKELDTTKQLTHTCTYIICSGLKFSYFRKSLGGIPWQSSV